MLNPWLYGRLKRIFKEVKVANQGVPLIVTEYIDPISGQKKYNIVQRGETYCVCCPFCQLVTRGRPDTRFRLWINHCYGIRNHPTGRRFWSLAYCYNENCLEVKEFAEALKDIVYGFETPPSYLEIPKPTIAETGSVELPTGLVPVNQLDSKHPARVYLESRGFDVEYLFNTFQIQYAEELDPRFPMMHQRIIIPIYVKGKLVGYQGRSIQPHELKYVTARGTRSTEILYGYDAYPQAMGHQLAIVVEGPADVWRIGPGALGMMGTHLSLQKAQLIRELGVKIVIVLYDGDLRTNPQGRRLINNCRSRLEQMGLQAVIRVLPEGKDPADFTREELYDYLNQIALSVFQPNRLASPHNLWQGDH